MPKASEQIKSVVIGPGAGEHVYDIDQSNVKQTIDTLLQNYPNLEKVSVVVGWFGDTTDAGKINIEPKVESKTGDEWQVGEYTRSTANKITVDSSGNLNWGGTPTDESIIEICSYLKEKGVNVTLYPMLFLDTDGKPWRGDISAKSDADVEHFFNEYNQFVKHYASLEVDGVKLKDLVSDFIIGSEFEKLTAYKNSANEFKSVEALKSLAAEIRELVGNDVKLTYAANWSEYHHTDGGWYHMDALWADKNIDYIGLDAYFRLTDIPHQATDPTPEQIVEAWQSGIDYDYYKVCGEKVGLNAKYAVKNFEWFWKHSHINPDGQKTEWEPKMKPIVFTEAGFTAVDQTTNEPYKYTDPKTIGAPLPEGSDGHVDAKIQYDAVVATLQFFENLKANPDTADMIADMTWYNVDPKGHGTDWSTNHELKVAEVEAGLFDHTEDLGTIQQQFAETTLEHCVVIDPNHL
jgi:hypothetical protein